MKTLILYGEDWCAPCQLVEDLLDELEVKYEKRSPKEKNLKSFPVLLIEPSQETLHGYKSEEFIVNWLKQNGLINGENSNSLKD